LDTKNWTYYVAWVYKLDRIAAMLSRLGGRGYFVQEDIAPYGQAEFDLDFDPDGIKANENMECESDMLLNCIKKLG